MCGKLLLLASRPCTRLQLLGPVVGPYAAPLFMQERLSPKQRVACGGTILQLLRPATSAQKGDGGGGWAAVAAPPPDYAAVRAAMVAVMDGGS